MNFKLKPFSFLISICFLSMIKLSAQKEAVSGLKYFTYEQMQTNWKNFSQDSAWKAVMSEMKRQGFTLINSDKTMWGLEGSSVNSFTKAVEPVLFCAFDFGKKGYNGLASMVWIKQGSKIYKCCITFPENEKNVDSAFAHSVEYYADANNRMQRAHSFGKCWRNACKSNCPTFCLSSITTCAGVAIALATAGIGVTTPIAIGVFAGCAGIACGGCLAVQAISCL